MSNIQNFVYNVHRQNICRDYKPIKSKNKCLNLNSCYWSHFENEVKVMWQMPDWRASYIINVLTKHSKPKFHGNGKTYVPVLLICILKFTDNEHQVKMRWIMPNYQVSTLINVLTKYGESRLYDNGETDSQLHLFKYRIIEYCW
jgi:hypothetical protein